jgi:hypothetical protein
VISLVDYVAGALLILRCCCRIWAVCVSSGSSAEWTRDDLGAVTRGGRDLPTVWSLPARVHSRYVRRLSDGAVGGRPVVIVLVVRRFFCVNPDCPVTTFAEQQVEGLSARYRRRTIPTLAMLE